MSASPRARLERELERRLGQAQRVARLVLAAAVELDEADDPIGDPDLVAVDQLRLAHRPVVDERAVVALGVADEVAARAPLDDRVVARRHAPGDDDVARRIPPDGDPLVTPTRSISYWSSAPGKTMSFGNRHDLRARAARESCLRALSLETGSASRSGAGRANQLACYATVPHEECQVSEEVHDAALHPARRHARRRSELPGRGRRGPPDARRRERRRDRLRGAGSRAPPSVPRRRGRVRRRAADRARRAGPRAGRAVASDRGGLPDRRGPGAQRRARGAGATSSPGSSPRTARAGSSPPRRSLIDWNPLRARGRLRRSGSCSRGGAGGGDAARVPLAPRWRAPAPAGCEPQERGRLADALDPDRAVVEQLLEHDERVDFLDRAQLDDRADAPRRR